jgi:transposase InsO family protein
VPHDVRDEVVDFVRRWSERTEITVGRFIHWLGVTASKFYDWRQRYGCVNEHNGWVPRDFWLEPWEKEAIIAFHLQNPLEGYRRLTFMMLDADILAVSPASVWRVLKQAGLLSRWKRRPSRKGNGFEQPLQPHQHWHIDVSYINLCGTFYYLCSVLDGFSRFLVHWDLRESMREADVEVILERAKEKHPEAKPRIISDNGPQFIARDFKEFIRISGMTHVRTSPYYPQSNGKLERWHKSLKSECIRPGTPLSLERCKTPDPTVCGPLQLCPAAQRHRLCNAKGYARGATGGDPRRARPQAGGGSPATPTATATSDLRGCGRAEFHGTVQNVAA